MKLEVREYYWAVQVNMDGTRCLSEVGPYHHERDAQSVVSSRFKGYGHVRSERWAVHPETSKGVKMNMLTEAPRYLPAACSTCGRGEG